MATFWTRINTVLLLVLLIAVIGALATRAWGGPLDPSNPPGSTLPQVEPRIPIDHVPFDITTPGSYFLTRDVSGSASTGDGITIEADDVTVDLNGFSVIGTGADTSQVHGFGLAVGTTLSPTPRHNIVIRNGVIRDWNYGVLGDRAHQSRIENVRVLGSKWDGIRGGADTTITDSSAASSNEYGIVSFGGTVQDSEVDNNGSAGIFVTDNSIVKDNSVHNNPFDGIDVANSASVEGNSVVASGGQGIVSSGGGDKIKDNLVQGSATNGIQVGDYSTVEGNTAAGNNTSAGVGSYGILVSGNRNTVAGNRAVTNHPSALFDQDMRISGDDNVVTGNRTGEPIGQGGLRNVIGPVVNLGNISTATNPYANLVE